MQFTDDGIHIDKEPNALDELILDVADVLDSAGVNYAVVSGYVVVLLGRARATEDIDVLVERFDEETGDEIAEKLRATGYWGSAMPLEEMHATLADGLPIRVARDGHRVPNVELKFPSDEFDRASLENTVPIRFDGNELTAGSVELQIAYKLSMGAQKDAEDALYLYEVTEGTLNTDALEKYVDRLGVRDEYERLRES
ncbi:nucleotidyltransferase domain-containing protein [Halorientalis pallida]|uniref:nucleotidyltransferase domain-containing protein n=1 Tax=Halorientalis pallida TaxID=2479928 RepID=UPI003C6F8D54